MKIYNRQQLTVISIDAINNNVKIHEAKQIELKNKIDKSTIRVGWRL